MILENSELGNQLCHSRATIFAKLIEPEHYKQRQGRGIQHLPNSSAGAMQIFNYIVCPA